MIQEQTITIREAFGGDGILFEKQFPTTLKKSLCPKPKYLDKVWVSFGYGRACEGYVLGLNGGDFGTSMKQDLYGDRIKFFFVPTRGEKFYKGEHEWWLMDIGIGKTKQEAIDTCEKYQWFKRSKAQLANDRFWAWWTTASPEEKLNHRKEWDHELKLTKIYQQK